MLLGSFLEVTWQDVLWHLVALEIATLVVELVEKRLTYCCGFRFIDDEIYSEGSLETYLTTKKQVYLIAVFTLFNLHKPIHEIVE